MKFIFSFMIMLISASLPAQVKKADSNSFIDRVNPNINAYKKHQNESHERGNIKVSSANQNHIHHKRKSHSVKGAYKD